MAQIHILNPGTYTDASGTVVSFSAADLAATAKAYDPKLHEAPLVLGHPQHNDPAYGWAKALHFSAENGLTATPHQVDPEFSEMYATGRIKKVSGSFYAPTSPNNPVPGIWYLRHIGFLGAQPPAVKGLRPAEFAESDDCITVDFSESPTPNPQETTMTPEEIKAMQAKLADMEARDAALAAENANLKKALDEAQAAADGAANEKMTAENTAFAESLAKEARIAPESVPLVVKALNFAMQPDAAGEVVSFGEGTAAKPLAEAMREFFKSLMPRVELGEVATKERAGEVDTVQYAENASPASIEMDKKVRAYMAQHKTDYTTAFKAVSSH